MKIYTKTGDKGQTSLFGGQRVSKANLRIESYGTLDELLSYIGLLRDQEINLPIEDFLIEIQDRLFTLGAELATAPLFDVVIENDNLDKALKEATDLVSNFIKKS